MPEPRPVKLCTHISAETSEKRGKVCWSINQKEPQPPTGELPELRDKARRAPQATQKGKAIFCESQLVLKGHIFF